MCWTQSITKNTEMPNVVSEMKEMLPEQVNICTICDKMKNRCKIPHKVGDC